MKSSVGTPGPTYCDPGGTTQCPSDHVGLSTLYVPVRPSRVLSSRVPPPSPWYPRTFSVDWVGVEESQNFLLVGSPTLPSSTPH